MADAVARVVPPWEAVYQQTQRWVNAGVFETMVHDLRVLLRWLQGRADDPTATIVDSRTMPSTPESGHRAGYDGHKRKNGSKIHAAVDTLGELLALHVTPADTGDRAQVAELTQAVQAVTGDHVDVAFVDQGYTGQPAAEAAKAHGIELVVVKLPDATQGFVLMPRRWVVERTFAWASRFRRLVPAGPGLRTLARNGGGIAFRGVYLPDAPSIGCPRRPKSITRSRGGQLRVRFDAQRGVLDHIDDP